MADNNISCHNLDENSIGTYSGPHESQIKWHSRHGPQPFWQQGPILWKMIFPLTDVGGEGFGMIQVHYIYCVLYS